MPAASRRAPRRARSWAWAPRPPSSSAGVSTLARFPPTACARWCGRSRHSRTSDRRPDGRRGVEPRGPLRVDLSVSLQDRQDRHARLPHRSVRDGPALAPEPVPGRGRGAHRGGRLRDPAGARAPLAPAPVRGPRVAVAPGGAAGLRRGALQRVSHRARAVRHSRDLPVLRRVRRPHHDHLPAGAPRPPPPDPDRGMTRAADRSGESEPPQPRALAGLWRAALGVVYGDIGTSPLYALKECFLPEHQLPPTPANVLGILSLIFWSLTFVISIKYVTVLLRADNRGEGGIMALLALVRPSEEAVGRRRALVMLGLFGTALLYGDGVITPAISVLGALEGISVATPALEHLIVPIAVAILIGLFLLQKRGTAGVGQVFGPIVILWFAMISVFGLIGIAKAPSVLGAINPWHAVDFFLRDRLAGFLVLGSVVLVFTGGEALYADMGHFGPRPIRRMWFFVAMPALLVNYFGQGALLLADPSAVDNPFYRLMPQVFLYPAVIVSLAAAVVASQALISGAFSLTRQAVQLGYSPRVTVVHTSHHEAGQIYVPEVNKVLLVACIALVIGFQSTSGLAGAYGIAVTGTMTITTILFASAARTRLAWSPWRVVPLVTLFLVVDLSFFGANLVKIPSGGWFPVLLAVAIFVLMATWKRGRYIVTTTMRENSLPLELFMQDLARRSPTRVPGTAVFMTSDAAIAPAVLLHHLKHNKVLHERVILMSVVTREIPQVSAAERIRLQAMGQGFYTLVVAYGFMESPDVPRILASLEPLGLQVKVMETTFYLGRETLIPTPAHRAKRAALLVKGLWMSLWRKRLFVLMTNNARSATAFFQLPANRVVGRGAQAQICAPSSQLS